MLGCKVIGHPPRDGRRLGRCGSAAMAVTLEGKGAEAQLLQRQGGVT